MSELQSLRLLKCANLLYTKEHYLESLLVYRLIELRKHCPADWINANSRLALNRLKESVVQSETSAVPLFFSSNINYAKLLVICLDKLAELPAHKEQLLLDLYNSLLLTMTRCVNVTEEEKVITVMNQILLIQDSSKLPSRSVILRQMLKGYKDQHDFWFNCFKKLQSFYADQDHFLLHLNFKRTQNFFESLSLLRPRTFASPCMPLVSICLSSYNSEGTIKYSAESVLSQSYRNLELIIVDDCSTDSSTLVIEDISKTDSRVKIIKNQANMGTYYNRNAAMSLSRGKYFAIHDADDYAHHRRVEKQVNQLLRCPDLIGCVGKWYRVSSNGRFIFKLGIDWTYLHLAVATLMFNKAKVVDKIGYYDENRFGADSEYMERIRHVFGWSSICVVDDPLAFALQSSGSLTCNPAFGVDEVWGQSSIRKEYQKAWTVWHKSTESPFVALHSRAGLRNFQ